MPTGKTGRQAFLQETAKLEQLVSQKEDRIRHLQEDVSATLTRYEAASTQLDSSKTSLNTLQIEVQSLRVDKRNSDAEQKQISILEQQSNDARRRAAAEQAKSLKLMEELNKEKDQHKALVAKLERDVKDYRKKTVTLEEEKSKHRESIVTLKEELREKTNEKEDIEDVLRNVTRENERKRSQIKKLEESLKELALATSREDHDISDGRSRSQSPVRTPGLVGLPNFPPGLRTITSVCLSCFLLDLLFNLIITC